jgi:hypothetical protein
MANTQGSMSDTPRTDAERYDPVAYFADMRKVDDGYYVPVGLAQKLERELAEAQAEIQRIQATFAGNVHLDNQRLERELAEAKREAAQWKASHDNQVNLRRALVDRADLKERARLIEEMNRGLTAAIAERDALLKAFREASILDEHGTPHTRKWSHCGVWLQPNEIVIHLSMPPCEVGTG